MSVSTNRQVVIKDACILFDLMDLDLLPSFYQLPLHVVTTQPVLDEIVGEPQIVAVNLYVSSGQLQVDQFGQFEAIVSITDTNPGLSFTDASVLEAAMRRNATVLSSDKSLRNESVRRSITVHGMLWILEELFFEKIIEQKILIEKLEAYPKVNHRAPLNEIKILLNKHKL